MKYRCYIEAHVDIDANSKGEAERMVMLGQGNVEADLSQDQFRIVCRVKEKMRSYDVAVAVKGYVVAESLGDAERRFFCDVKAAIDSRVPCAGMSTVEIVRCAAK
ncbi:MAG: hypothetical protein FWD69_10265 [Polyangiaceae bacterium]|nr:hypothetical protein [Polyangiaceae bacterium]